MSVTSLPVVLQGQVPRPKLVKALAHVRKMRGGSQSHLMICSDGEYYVVKFKSNPQHSRVIVNEMIGTHLAMSLGLPAMPFALVEVDEQLIKSNPTLNVELSEGKIPCQPGIHFGSLHLGPRGKALDYFPHTIFDRVWNADAVVGALAFDKWTANTDQRQFIFMTRPPMRNTYFAAMIDQGHCFGAGDWNFKAKPAHGFYMHKAIYHHVEGFASFEPWLTRIENLEPSLIWAVAQDVPPSWYDHRWSDVERMIKTLIARRTEIRCQVEQSCLYSNLCPKWHGDVILGRIHEA
jgi:hypothetical protein